MQIEVAGVRGDIQALPGRVMVADIEVGMKKVGNILVPDDNGLVRGIHPRWGQVVSVGEGLEEDLEPGQWVLIEHGRWSWGLKVDADGVEKKLHGIDPAAILLVADEDPRYPTL